MIKYFGKDSQTDLAVLKIEKESKKQHKIVTRYKSCKRHYHFLQKKEENFFIEYLQFAFIWCIMLFGRKFGEIWHFFKGVKQPKS